ncbi:biotin transporter BioY [Bacillus methanolicus]|uniref:biotin transporter BioY n=1 Tax=Bacillus methanolicus TaxID=1471 RepID=UPI002380A9A6|nr:biotin transporter BioY [Bacillus methanolicus]MDE3838883.1 biotin transporter BioY [Bacillus methanolicus]
MKTKHMTLAAIFAAMTAIGGFIKIPIPYVPFTLQIVSVFLAGSLLGPRLGALSQLLYVFIGLIGVPVFAEGGGFGYVLKPTFGYLIGFVLGAYVSGLIVEKVKKRSIKTLAAANFASLLTVYTIGCVWLYGVMKFVVEKPLTIKQTVLYGFLIPVPGDIILCIICSILASKILARLSGLPVGKGVAA